MRSSPSHDPSESRRPAGARRRLGLIALFAAVLSALGTAPPTPVRAAGTLLTVSGHGWGHGRGMGQWGAFGYAQNAGWDHKQILAHYYGGTVAGAIPGDTQITVRLVSQDNRDVVVTSGVPFVVGNITVDPWRGIRITQLADGRFQMFVSNACGQPELQNYAPIIPNGVVTSTVADPGNDINKMLTICNSGGSGKNISYRGAIELLQGTASNDAGKRTINRVSMEQYLRGVVPRESPASWPAAALRAQAVAARSYAQSEARYAYAETCDTTACQVYGGAGNSGTYLEAPSTDAAIAATAGEVRVGTVSGAVSRTEFSASTGGYTAGGTFPAVRDDGDAVATNPHHNWNATIDIAALSAKYGIGTFLGIDILSRNGFGEWGGRVVQLRVRGTTKSVTLSGNQFRSDWGLKSDWYLITGSVSFIDWYLRNSNTPGAPDVQTTYGTRIDRPLVGDWNGDGLDTVGVYELGTFYLRDANSPGSANYVVKYGAAGYTPIVGDWNGDGTDTVGVYAGGVFYLRDANTPGPPTYTVPYGASTWIPVVGDWNGDGTDTVGVFSNGMFFLRDSNSPGAPTYTVSYGAANYTPVVGDWNGDGTDTIGVFSNGVFFLRDSNTPGAPTYTVPYGAPGYIPVVGDWDENGTDTVGVAVVPPS